MSDIEPWTERSDRPAAADGAARAARQRDLGLANVPDARFDALARKIIEATGASAAMVNLVGEDRQYFAGLAGRPPAGPGEPAFLGDPGREMDMEHGFCVNVVARRKALVLDDIYSYPRFAGNPVVDELGVRSYLGAPLIDDDGTVLGTVCAIDPAPRSAEDQTSWGTHGLSVIKSVASEVVAEIRNRQKVGLVTADAPGSVLVVEAADLAILHVNAAHEQLFGALDALGADARRTYPGLEAVGILAAIDHVIRTGATAATAPVPVGDDGRSILFAVVPARLPGHDAALLTLGMVDADAPTCVAAAEHLAATLSGLSD
jgi:GAF domain-containing protein